MRIVKLVFSNDPGTEARIIQFTDPALQENINDAVIGICYEYPDAEVAPGPKLRDTLNVKAPLCVPLANYEFYSDLEGKLLTLIDAMFTDDKQRESFKSLIRNSVNDVYSKHTEMIRQTIEVLDASLEGSKMTIKGDVINSK